MSIACSATHCQSAQLLSHTQSLSMYTSSACSFSRRPRTPASAAAPLAALPDLRRCWSDGVGQTVLVSVLGIPASKFNHDRLGRTLDALYPHLNALWGDDRTPFLSKTQAPGTCPAILTVHRGPIQLKAEQPCSKGRSKDQTDNRHQLDQDVERRAAGVFEGVPLSIAHNRCLVRG